MTKYIVLLRGINVSGKNIIKMAELKILLENIGFENITTYIQSGNIVLDSVIEEKSKIEEIIQSSIKNSFKLDVPLKAINFDELKQITEQNPFINLSDIDFSKLHYTILSNEPSSDLINKLVLNSYEPDNFKIIKNVIYLYCPNGYGNTKLSNTFFEKKLKVNATTRNFNTISKLIEIASS
jgi:uncharacterized protein (DUF1697 family)